MIFEHLHGCFFFLTNSFFAERILIRVCFSYDLIIYECHILEQFYFGFNLELRINIFFLFFYLKALDILMRVIFLASSIIYECHIFEQMRILGFSDVLMYVSY